MSSREDPGLGVEPLPLPVARAWGVLAGSLAVVGFAVSWSRFTAPVHGHHHRALELYLAQSGIPASVAVVHALSLVGALGQALVFVGCAIALAIVGRRRALPWILAAGLPAYVVATGAPRGGEGPWQWLFDVNRIIAVTTLAYGVITLPTGRFSRRAHIVLWLAWSATTWLVLYPVGLPWEGLRHSTASHVVQLVFLVAGALIMVFHYARGGPEIRAQLKWVLSGVSTAVFAFTLSELVPLRGAHGAFLSLVLYPLMLCVLPVVTTMAVLKIRLWDLSDVQREIAMGVFPLVGALGGTFVLTEIAAVLAYDGGTPPLGIVLACLVGASAVVITIHRHLAGVIERMVFPLHRDRSYAVRLGISALEDALAVEEALWAIEGLVELGWPGSTVEIIRDDGLLLAAPEREERRSIPAAAGVFGVVSETNEKPPVLWARLAWQEERVGWLRVVPPVRDGFSTSDLEMLGRVVTPLSAAVWRVTRA